MTPMHVTCPQCRAPLQLMIPSLPARATCPHCRNAFTLQANPAAVPPAPIPVPPPAGVGRGFSGAVRLGVVCVLLGGFVAGGIVLAKFCLSDDSPAGPQTTPPPRVQPVSTTPAPPPVDPVVAERRKKVKRAIERGVARLKLLVEEEAFNRPFYAQSVTRRDISEACFAGLTLLECGVSPKDPAIEKVAFRVRQEGRKLFYTYSLSASLLFLDRLENPADEDLIRALALQLVAGQTTNGGWGYSGAPLLSAGDREGLLAALRGQGPVPAAALPRASYETNSNTQFAVLGLWMARKHKLPVDAALARVAERFRKHQNADGSWGYGTPSQSLRDSMTCAGLLGVGVGRGLEATGPKASAGKAQDPAIDKGLRYLAATLKALTPVAAREKVRRLDEAEAIDRLTTSWPKLSKEQTKEITTRIRAQVQWRGALVNAEAMGDLYFLWSVERVAVLYGLKTIGELDWYAWGADLLLANQQIDGSWRERFPGIPDTCFALLFLRRANLIKDLTERLQGSLGLSADVGTRSNNSATRQ